MKTFSDSRTDASRSNAENIGARAISRRAAPTGAGPANGLVHQLAQIRVAQLARIPGTELDTATIEVDPERLAHLPVIGLIQFWHSVYEEDAENAREWRLAICGKILENLAARRYGPHDSAMLTGLSAAAVNEGLQNRTAMGAGSTKAVASIDVGDKEYAAARMQGSLSEDTIRDEAAMLQILGMLGVRVPQLYGVPGPRDQKQLPRDDQGKLNMIMTKVNSSHPAYQIYDMPVNTLATKLEEFLNAHHGNDAQRFRILQTNMLGDLRAIRDVYEVLAIADLQVLIDDNTGRVTTFDPGAVVPRGHAGDQTKENNTRQNLVHACQRIAAFTFRAQASGAYVISNEDAVYIGNYVSVRDLIFRINKVLKRNEISNVKDATVTGQDMREVIRVNAGKSDLGEMVDNDKLEEAIALLRGSD